MSHYFAQEMFAQVLVSPTLLPSSNTLKVSIVSDHLEPLARLQLMVKIQRWDQLQTSHQQVVDIPQLQAQSVTEIQMDFQALLQKGRCHGSEPTLLSFNYCFLTFK